MDTPVVFLFRLVIPKMSPSRNSKLVPMPFQGPINSFSKRKLRFGERVKYAQRAKKVNGYFCHIYELAGATR